MTIQQLLQLYIISFKELSSITQTFEFLIIKHGPTLHRGGYQGRTNSHEHTS